MYIAFTRRADKDYSKLSQILCKQVDKQLDLLIANIRHPSLDAKKYGGLENVWQGRVNKSYRFYFYIIDDTYQILRIIPHPK